MLPASQDSSQSQRLDFDALIRHNFQFFYWVLKIFLYLFLDLEGLEYEYKAVDLLKGEQFASGQKPNNVS